HDHVARIHRDSAAADGHVEVDRVVVDQVQRRAAARAIDGKVHLGNGPAVAYGSVGDEARGPADLEPRREYLATRGDALFAAAIDHQHMALGHALDALALRMVRIVECTDLIEVLARRDVAHREGRTDEIA